MKMIEWLSGHIPGVQPSKVLAIKAIRHLKKKEKNHLFSHDISQMRAAEGRWYESLIYELVLEIATQSDLVAGIVRKGADAPFPPAEISSDQNGLYYSNRGDINIRGNGQDIAEVDLLLVSSSRSIAFAEIVTSPTDLKGLEAEILYKKTLLGYLFGQVHVPFMLFSSVDISKSAIVKRLMREPDSVLIVTGTCDDLKKLLKPRDIRGIPRKPIRHKKLITLESVRPQRTFDYRQLHDLRRDKLIHMLMSGEQIPPGTRRDEIPPLVKKILFGSLYPSGIKMLVKKTSFSIKDHPHTYADITRDFSKIIIAVDLPEYEPVFYFRLKDKKEYLKIVPYKSGSFRIESRRSKRMKGFFFWLESLEPSIGASVTERYITAFLKQ